jgi:peptidoglycan/xylan/chitin deacetylase (PgdA/CDA1 family)
MIRRLLLAVVLLLACSPAHADKRIALSFDDVPRDRGGFFTPAERTRRIIAALESTHAPQAAFFVVPGQIGHDDGIGGERRIAAYVRAGNVIANHSWSHPHLSETGALAFLDDLDKADAWLRHRPGFRPWFRFPYLDEGGTDKGRRDTVRAGLARRGLGSAYVTAESSDWNLEFLAAQARAAGKPMNLAALGRLYVRWHVEAAAFADGLLQQTTGRQPAQVLLLHETDLAALHLADLIRGLRKAGWTIVSADEAYADPLAREMPDIPIANGTLTEALAWQKGLPAPRRYTYNDTQLAKQVFDSEVLGAKPPQ